MKQTILSALFGGVAGFLTRPCCVVPAAMSLAGLGTAGVAQAAIVYRPAFLAASAAMRTASLWISVRRDGGWFTKILSVAATVAGFAISGSVVMFKRLISVIVLAGSAWALPTPASAQMT